MNIFESRLDILLDGFTIAQWAAYGKLKAEIATYIEDRPGCSAADIVAYLSNERRMRNHGLTARKIGYFIPRHMKNKIGFKLDATTGKRIYHAMG